jgi:hypothetical protein
MLPTAVQLSAALAKLAMTLDKRPDLTRNLRKLSSVDMGGDGEGRKTLVETSAETIQRAFTMCLNDRTPSRSGVDRDGHVEGKKIGIYKFANLVLKLLFQVCQYPYPLPPSSIFRASLSRLVTNELVLTLIFL